MRHIQARTKRTNFFFHGFNCLSKCHFNHRHWLCTFSGTFEEESQLFLCSNMCQGVTITLSFAIYTNLVTHTVSEFLLDVRKQLLTPSLLVIWFSERWCQDDNSVWWFRREKIKRHERWWWNDNSIMRIRWGVADGVLSVGRLKLVVQSLTKSPSARSVTKGPRYRSWRSFEGERIVEGSKMSVALNFEAEKNPFRASLGSEATTLGPWRPRWPLKRVWHQLVKLIPVPTDSN